MKFLKRFIYLEKYNASFHKETPKLSARGASSRRTRRCAVCAVLCAFVVAVLMLGTLSGVLDLTALAVTSSVTVFCVLEFGGAYPYLVWCVSSVCAFLFLPDKLVACEYFLFAGIYPVLKSALSKLPYGRGFVIKLITFNAVLTLCAVISKYVLALPDDAGMVFGIPLYLGGNLVFILYDLALTSVTSYYIMKLRKILKADRL